MGILTPLEDELNKISVDFEKKKKKDTCIPAFTTALFIIAEIWKQPKCSSVDDLLKKMWYIYMMEYYSAI